MKTRTTALVGIAALAVATLAVADNPRGTASATIAGKSLTVDYGRPAIKGRALEELMKQLPADRIWRAGENQVSTLTTEGDILVGGQKLPAGKYSLYVHAGEGNAWSLVLNKDLGVPLGQVWAQAPEKVKNEPWPHMMDYTKAIADKEVVRAKMAAATADAPAELFTIGFAPKGTGAELTLAWGAQAWSLELQPAK
jgi:hypothetical protein